MKFTRDEGMSLVNLKDGAIVERFDEELRRVIENINDPNTNPTAERQIILKVKFKPDADRLVTKFRIACGSVLPGSDMIEGQCLIESGRGGAVGAREILPAQQNMFPKESDKVTPIKKGDQG